MSTARYQFSLLEVLARCFDSACPPVDIPPYQRPYRWSISDVRKLLDDLDSFRYKQEQTKQETTEQDEGRREGPSSWESKRGGYDANATYYYGVVCFHAQYKTLEGIDGQRRLTLELIDGQQRLTSFLILLKALLDATNGISEVKEKREALIQLIREKSAKEDWQQDQWRPRFEYRQPQTQEHIGTIYREQLADYQRVKALVTEATQTSAAGQDSLGGNKLSDYVREFFEQELERLRYALQNGVFAVRVIENRYDAELFFQCENNRGKEMELVDLLKAYHLRIALSVEKATHEDVEASKATVEKIEKIWKELTDSEERFARFKTTVIGLLLIRLGVAYWMHWDKTNVEKLKGIHGTYRGNRVVDKKLARTGAGTESSGTDFLPDLMTPVPPGLPFFKTLSYYQRIVEALYRSCDCAQAEGMGCVESSRNMFQNMVLDKERYFDDSHAIAVQAMVCWLDRFACAFPNLEEPIDKDIDRLCRAYSKDMDFLVYAQFFIRLFKRLRTSLKIKVKSNDGKENTKEILVFGQLRGVRQIEFFKLDRPTENLITLPYRTNSPAECRRELERLTHPDQVGWAMVRGRTEQYREYVELEDFAALQKSKEQAK